MKTLRKGDTVKRFKDSTRKEWRHIQKLVKEEGWAFCDKSTWRELRDGKKD